MSEYVHKSHNVTVLLYHMVFPAKYRRAIFDEAVDVELKAVCLEIEKRYELKFLAIGTDRDHVHFLVQSVPKYSVTKLVRVINSLTVREVFSRCPEVKKHTCGVGSFGAMGVSPVRWGNTAVRRRQLRQETRWGVSEASS